MNLFKKATRIIILIFFSAMPFDQIAFARLTDESLDYFILKSDLIIEGEVTEKIQGDIDLVKVKVVNCYLGTTEESIFIISRTERKWIEDEPVFKVGEDAIFFLFKKDGNKYYECVHGVAGQVNDITRSQFYPYDTKDNFIMAIKQLIEIKKEKVQHKKYEMLINLLDSENLFTVRSASSYLAFLVNGQIYEEWEFRSPHDRQLNYQEYFKKNMALQKEKWKAWWQEQNNPASLKNK